MWFIINGLKWLVIEVEADNPNLWNGKRGYTLGMCDGNACKIYINRDLSNWKYEKVLIHEICHAFIFSWNLHFSEDQEEEFCNLFAEHGREMIYVADKILNAVMLDNFIN